MDTPAGRRRSNSRVSGRYIGDFRGLFNPQVKYAGVQDIEMGDDESSVFPDPITIDDSDELLAHAVKDLKLKHKLYNPIEKGCEYTRREFISAVLGLAASFAGVKLACEEQVEGSAGKGLVDWMAHYQNHRICITEGEKKDNISLVVCIKILHNWRLSAKAEPRNVLFALFCLYSTSQRLPQSEYSFV